MENKPLEWDEYMKPYRNKKLFCNTVKRRIMPTYTEIELRSWLKTMGYEEKGITAHINLLKELRQFDNNERKGDDD